MSVQGEGNEASADAPRQTPQVFTEEQRQRLRAAIDAELKKAADKLTPEQFTQLGDEIQRRIAQLKRGMEEKQQ